MKKILFFLALLVTVAPQFVFAQGATTLDGWTVTFQGASQGSGNTTFAYKACPTGTGKTLKVFSLGVPSCFPSYQIVSASPATSTSIDRNYSNGVLGIVWSNLNATSCQTFSYTVAGTIQPGGQISLGVTSADSCASCCTDCGSAGTIDGPLCTVSGKGSCGQISRADISIMFDQSSCVSRASADAERNAAIQFAANQSALREHAQIAIGSYHYGNSSSCNTTGWPTGFAKPYLKDYATYISLLNGTLTKSVTGWDYDGFLQKNYGVRGTNEDNSSNTYRALYGFANQSPYTCGKAPLGAALEVSDRHLSSVYGSGYGDPQTPNYAIIVSTGRPNQLSNGTACSNPCDCSQARQEAVNSRNNAIAHGMKVFAIYLDDGSCSCSAAQIQTGKDFLKNQS